MPSSDQVDENRACHKYNKGRTSPKIYVGSGGELCEPEWVRNEVEMGKGGMGPLTLTLQISDPLD